MNEDTVLAIVLLASLFGLFIGGVLEFAPRMVDGSGVQGAFPIAAILVSIIDLLACFSYSRRWGLICAGGLGVFFGIFSFIYHGMIVPWWISIIVVIVLGEIIFLIEKDKPTKTEMKKLFRFTVGEKACCLAIATGVYVSGMGLIYLMIDAVPWIAENASAIICTLGWVGIAAIVLGAIVGYIKLNTLKYRNVKYPKRRRKKRRAR